MFSIMFQPNRIESNILWEWIVDSNCYFDCNYISLTSIEIHKFHFGCQKFLYFSFPISAAFWVASAWISISKFYKKIHYNICMWSQVDLAVFETSQTVKLQFLSHALSRIYFKKKPRQTSMKKIETHKFTIIFYSLKFVPS